MIVVLTTKTTIDNGNSDAEQCEGMMMMKTGDMMMMMMRTGDDDDENSQLVITAMRSQNMVMMRTVR